MNIVKRREITLYTTFAHFDLHAVEQFSPPDHFHFSLWKPQAVSDLIVIAIVVEPYILLTMIINLPYHCFIDFFTLSYNSHLLFSHAKGNLNPLIFLIL